MAVAHDAAAVAERLLKRHTERDTRILNGVVSIDLQIALNGNLKTEATVNAERREHMVKKADARRNLDSAAVKAKFDLNLCFLCISFNNRCSHINILYSKRTLIEFA